MFKDKNILYIVHDYNFFQKDPIEEVSKYFNKVYVLVRYRPLSWFAKYLPVKSLRKYEDSYVIDLTDLPKNVEVIRTPVWYLPIGIFYKWLGDLHFKAVDKAIKKHNIKFDLVHCHFISSSGYVGMRLKEKYNKPFVVTGHGFDVYDQPFKSEYWKEKTIRVLRKVDKVLTVGRKNKEILKELGVKESKIVVIPNGFNSDLIFPLDKIESRKELDIPQEKKVVLSIGNLEEVKGHKYLIEAMRILRKKYPDISCYIIGGGSLENSLQGMIDKYKLGDSVFLLGYLKHDKINKWINACDLFVLPSLAESFGIVQIEAFACGKPVVATKNEGSKEVVTSEEYGYLCEIGDPEDLARKIEEALKQDWSDENVMKYSGRFRQEEINKELEELYKKVLAKS